MLLHLWLVLQLSLIFISFSVGITFAVVITFSGDTAISKLNVLKSSFAQEILVILLQHRVVFFNRNLQLHLYLKTSLDCPKLVLNF